MFSLAQAIDDPLDLGRRHGQDDLVRAVVHRDVDTARRQRRGRAPRRGLGRSATATRRAAGKSPDDSKPRKIAPSRPSLLLERPIGLEDTRGGQGQHLAAAVAEHGVGLQAQPGQDLVQGPLRVEDDVHRRRGRPELFVTARHRPNRCSLGGTVSPRSRAMRSAVSNRRRTSGKWKQRSASIPGYCEPSPGKRKARPPAPPSRAARPSSRRPGRRESTGKRGRPGAGARR